ncbi:hypothetical protein XU18_1635 [Perkinsela sp. CCAP 1560/4]|nr:hypothetical protein XU18_1635 [Perkinsela sp. CCAP 1560/4]|eukprot:KNH07744.1 hypothetical protein XU18_1635 [Perkinsela sp. CCAP 1560/4]
MLFGSVRSARRSDRSARPIVYDWRYLLSLRAEHTQPPIGMRSLEHLKLSAEELSRIQEPTTSCFSRDSMLNVLSTGENAWRSTKSSQDEDQKFLKEIRGMLNKITPKKYVDVVCRSDLIGVYTSDARMSAVVGLIFDKALQDPTYSQLYVEFSKDIHNFAPRPEKGVEFRRQIIDQTQFVFENAVLRAEDAVDELTEHKLRKRQLANMKFIGELFMSDLINTNSADFIISSLLGENSAAAPSPAAIEMVSTFLRRVGGALAKSGAEIIDHAARRLAFLLKHAEYPTRVRFMIMDILEARASNWTSRCINPSDQNVILRPTSTG